MAEAPVEEIVQPFRTGDGMDFVCSCGNLVIECREYVLLFWEWGTTGDTTDGEKRSANTRFSCGFGFA